MARTPAATWTYQYCTVLHDSSLFKNQMDPAVADEVKPFPSVWCMLGEEGYKSAETADWILTPIPADQLIPRSDENPDGNPPELVDKYQNFNDRQSRARNIVERGFGKMKQQWRFLKTTQRMDGRAYPSGYIGTAS